MAASNNSRQPNMTNIKRLQKILSDRGRDVLKPSRSKEELILKLDKLEHLLSHIKQEVRVVVVGALKPSKEALFSDTILKHEEMGVRLRVAACMSEIIRITAPYDPFEESQMKVFFQLVNSTAYQNLPCMERPVHTRNLSILEIISRSQSCVLMLDLELFDLIHEMFHLFLHGIRSEHPSAMFSYMENIMTLIVSNSLDCDGLTLELTKIVLPCLNKESLNTPTTSELANKVFEKCVDYVKTHVPDAVRSLGVPVSCYPDIVSSLCSDEIQRDNMDFTEDGMASLHLGQVGQPVDNGLPKLAEENKTVGSKNDEIITENAGKSPTSRDETQNIDSPKKTPLKEPRQVDALNLGKRIPKTNSFKKPEEGYEFHSSSRSLAGQSNSKRTSRITKHAGEGSSRSITVTENMGSKSIASTNLTGDIDVKASTSRSKGKEAQSGEVPIPQHQILCARFNEEINKHFAKPNRPSNQLDSAENSGSKNVTTAQNVAEDILIKTLASNSRSTSLKEEAQPGKANNRQRKKDSKTNKKKASKDGGRSFGEELVGSRIKVWWPLEKKFFEGKVTSFNNVTKMHEVYYDDGDHETLDLTKERWQMLPQDNLSTHEQNTTTTAPSAATDTSGNPEERNSDHLCLEERWSLMLD